MPKKANSGRDHVLDLRKAVVGGNLLHAANDQPEPSHPALVQFKRWYERTGHWVYNGRAEAATVWVGRGISTLPQAPAGAAEALAAWVAADPFLDVQRFAAGLPPVAGD